LPDGEGWGVIGMRRDISVCFVSGGFLIIAVNVWIENSAIVFGETRSMKRMFSVDFVGLF